MKSPRLAIHDLIAIAYMFVLLAATLAGGGPRRATALTYLTLDIAGFFLCLVLSRGRFVTGKLADVVYRIGIFIAIFGTFSHLQYILPTARAVRLDAEIYAFDLRVFGFEPAEFFDRFVSPTTVEWFSFFYFGYFFVLAVHVPPFMFLVKHDRLVAEFSFAFVALFAVGHSLYMVVPGHGPYQYLAGSFKHALDGPLWWPLVKAATDAGEVKARTDIFPSLHTAAPAFLTLFSFRNRRMSPFRWSWIPLAFFTSQIAISTMFLRWHYVIDVVAGLALATGVAIVAPRVTEWERVRAESGRERESVQAIRA